MAQHPTHAQIITHCWKLGELRYKLYPYQRPLYLDLLAAINDKTCLKYVLNCSRRWGKTTILCLIALETALKQPNKMIRFAAGSRTDLKKIIQPIMRMLIQDAPSQYKPTFHQMDGVYKFYNGSEIHLGGVNNDRGDTLRGTTSHLNIVDEAGFIDDLNYILSDILLPQTLTTGGTTLLASTPPKTPAHDFYNIAIDCEAAGNYKKYTIYDNPTIDEFTISTYMKESGGENSSTWKREYLAEFVIDENSVIIPEWKEEYIREEVHCPLYQHYHKYIGMDLGVKDFTAAIFGYYDFKQATLFIEEEYMLNGPEFTTTRLYRDLNAIEKRLWGELPVYLRVADNNDKSLLQTLSNEHKQIWRATDKATLEFMLNQVREMVDRGQIIINPSCEKLIGCLKYAVWDNKRQKLARSSVYGHFDHLMALVYLVRNLDKQTNTIPRFLGVDHSTHFVSPNYNKDVHSTAKIFSDMMKPPTKRR